MEQIPDAPWITNIFFEDVQSFFDINSIPYIQNAQFSGSSGLSHTFEFTNADHLEIQMVI